LKKVGDEKKAEWGHYWIDKRFEGGEIWEPEPYSAIFFMKPFVQ
jgi:hypothetical protein